MSKEVFEDLKAGLIEALAWSRNEIALPVHQYPPAEADRSVPPKDRVVGSNPTRGTKLFKKDLDFHGKV